MSQEPSRVPEYTIIDGFLYERVYDAGQADLIFSDKGYWKKKGPVKQVLEEPFDGGDGKILLTE